MKVKFEAVDGNIFVVVTQVLWGEEIEVLREEATNEVEKIVFVALNQVLSRDTKMVEGEV